MKKGFTLIELLVVIVIIGILATLATVGLNSVRAKARDSKRISDIRQMQSALELYFNDNNAYPTNGDFAIGTPLDSPDGTKTYMAKIPSNPKPWAEGACSSAGTEYTYNYINANSYQLSYCLANNVNDIVAGQCTARPGNICSSCAKQCGGKYCGDSNGCGGVCGSGDGVNLSSGASAITGLTCGSSGVMCGSTIVSDYNKINTCTVGTGVIACGGTSGGCTGIQLCSSGSCSNPTPCNAVTRTTECTNSNAYGDICGGGYLFCKSDGSAGSIECGNINLVSSPPLDSGGVCSTGNDALVKRWDNSGSPTYLNFTDLYDGRNSFSDGLDSTTAKNNLSKYEAAKFCLDLVLNGFDDWYLPSRAELCAMFRSGNYCGSFTGSCVAASGRAASGVALNGCTNGSPLVKGFVSGTDYQFVEDANASNVYTMAPNDSAIYNGQTKTTNSRFRCIRRF